LQFRRPDGKSKEKISIEDFKDIRQKAVQVTKDRANALDKHKDSDPGHVKAYENFCTITKKLGGMPQESQYLKQKQKETARESDINSGNMRTRNRACGGRMRSAIGVSSRKGGLGVGSTKCGMAGSRGLGGINSGQRASGIKNIPSRSSAGMNSGGRTGGVKNIPSRSGIGMNSGRRASGIKSRAIGGIRSSASRG
jgi:hypothetical protein